MDPLSPAAPPTTDRTRSLTPRRSSLLALSTTFAVAAAAQTDAGDSAGQAGPTRVAANVLEPVTVTGHRGDTYLVDDATSATKLTLTPRETPQSMTVITRQRLDDQDLTSLRKVLDNTPGIYSNAYDSERVLFYSRGFLIDTLMYDGVPALPNFTTGSVEDSLDTALYERIEVVRGATGLTTGAGNPAASINMVRKHADSRLPTVSFDLSFDLSLGSWRDRRAQVDATLPLAADGSIRARVVAAAEDRDSYQALYHKRTAVFYGIVDAEPSPATRVSVGYDYQNNRPRGNTWGSFPLFLSNGAQADWPRSVTTATNWSFWNKKTQTLFGELRHQFDNGWTLRSTLSHRRFDDDVALFYVYGFPDATTGTGLDPYAYRSRDKVTETALDVYASGPVELFGRWHELVAGYNGSRAKNVGIGYPVVGTLASTGNFFQWDGSYPKPEFGPGAPLTDNKTTQDALYIAGRFALNDSLKLIAGARYARWKVDSFNVSNTPAEDLSKAIPYAGLIWNVTSQFSAFASYTGIFKPQNNRDITGRYLDPMEGTSVEVGIKGEHFDRQLNTAFTVFETRQNNVAAPVLDPTSGQAVLFPDGSAVSQAINGTRTRGFEIEAAGKLGAEWQGSFGWTRYLTKDASGETIRTFIPGTLIRLFATWEPRHMIDGLSVGAGVNWQSTSSTTVGSPGGATVLTQGSLAQVSAMARYRFTPNLSVQFNANNVYDKKYYVLDQYDNSYYGTPASYALTLKISY